MRYESYAELQQPESLQELAMRIDFVRGDVRALDKKISLLGRDVRADIRHPNAVELRRKWRHLVATLSDMTTMAETLDTTEP